jgi:hypothetical protein
VHTVGFHGRPRTGRARGVFRLDVRRRTGHTSPVSAPAARLFPGAGRREGGALMAEAAVQVSVTVAGWAERARVPRAFTAGVTGPGHPCGADAALLVSELSGSRLRHSRPGVPGETVTIRAGTALSGWRSPAAAAPGVPELGPADRDAEGSRGLSSLRAMRRGEGWRRRGGRMVTWLSHGWHLRLTAAPA